MCATKYKMILPENDSCIERSYRGDIRTVAGKAWRDIKGRHWHRAPSVIRIINLGIGETYDIDLRYWQPARKRVRSQALAHGNYLNNDSEIKRRKQYERAQRYDIFYKKHARVTPEAKNTPQAHQ